MGYLAIGALFIILLITMLFLPLSLTKISRMIILVTGLIIATLIFTLYAYLHIWQLSLIAILLLGCSSYFLIKYIPIHEDTIIEHFSYMPTIQSIQEEIKLEKIEITEIEVEQYEIIEVEEDLEHLFNFKEQLQEEKTEKLEKETIDNLRLDNLDFDMEDLQDKLY